MFMNSPGAMKALSRIALGVVSIAGGWLWFRSRSGQTPAPAALAVSAKPAVRATGARVRRPAPPPALNPPPPADNPAGRSYLETPVLPVPAEAESDLLGMAAGQRIAELTDWKDSLKAATATLEARLHQASEAELLSYFDRLKTSGELEAIRWLEGKPAQP